MEVETQGRLLESRTCTANLLGISLRKLEHLIAEKRLKVVRIGKRVLVPRTVIEAFIRREAR